MISVNLIFRPCFLVCIYSYRSILFQALSYLCRDIKYIVSLNRPYTLYPLKLPVIEFLKLRYCMDSIIMQ